MKEEKFYLYTLTNGFVMMGQQGDNSTIVHCYNVRRYGTKKGAGQLAIEGIQKETVLDYCGLVSYNPAHLIFKTLLTDEAAKTFKRYAGI